MKNRLHRTNRPSFNFIGKILSIIVVSMIFFSCEEDDKRIENQVDDEPPLTEGWQRVFNDEFDDYSSFNNWELTNRFDYNSVYGKYVSAVPYVDLIHGKSVLVLTATPSGEIYETGHVKSKFDFKPARNEEFHVSASIRLLAMKEADTMAFADTYGAWPAFWTVQESDWPVSGEIDIMEGYSYAGQTRFASNIFYGTTVGKNLLGTTAEREYHLDEGWHTYDMHWENSNGVITITTKVDGEIRATYTNETNANLDLSKFGPHNIIFNLNVGDNYGIFDNSQINLFTKTMMWVDYVTVNKRTI